MFETIHKKMLQNVSIIEAELCQGYDGTAGAHFSYLLIFLLQYVYDVEK